MQPLELLSAMRLVCSLQMSMLEKRAMVFFLEERRLQHVAITRGKERVFLTYLRASKFKELEPSAFLNRVKPVAKCIKFKESAAEKNARRQGIVITEYEE